MLLGERRVNSRTASWSILRVLHGEFSVENSDSDLHPVVSSFVGPLHLLLLRHAMADNLIHC